MGRLSLALLGPPEVRHGERLLTFRTRKTLALLVFLAAEGGRHSRERLSTLFWPESEPALGRATLRTTLGYLHTALQAAPGESDASGHLTVTRDALAFERAAPHAADLALVEAAVAAPRVPPARAELLARLRAAAGSYRGEFLAGFSLDDAPEFDDWATAQREAWHHRIGLVFDRLTQILGDGGEIQEAIEFAARWVALDGLNEGAHRRLIALHLAAGDRAAALRAFATCKAVLADELGIDPEAVTVALAERARALPPPRPAATDAPRQSQAAPLTALLDAPLVGRAEEFGALIAAFAAARRGETRLVTIEGEAGIGKTRLAADFLTWARGQGAEPLLGRAFETGGRLPYQPLIDALRRPLAEVVLPQHLLGETWLAELSRLWPDIREQIPGLASPATDDATAQGWLFETVAELGRVLAARGPQVLHIDDLQWADAATIDLLAFLARRWAERAAPILILLGLRAEGLTSPDAARPALGDWIADLARAVPLTRLPLAALSEAATAQLLVALLGAAGSASGDLAVAGRWLFAETSGQPFYVLETMKALFEQGIVAAHPDGPGQLALDLAALTGQEGAGRRAVPAGVRDLILRRLGNLRPEAMTALAAAAVLGHGFDFTLLCQVAGLSDDAGLAALDQALAARLLRESGDGAGTYAFAHDRIRDVVYTEAGEARRRVFHRRALSALQKQGAPAAELARHAAASGQAAAAFQHHLAAGDAALAHFAVRDAIAHYESARAALAGSGPAGAPLADREHLYARLARAYEVVNDLQRARATYEAMLAFARGAGSESAEWTALSNLAALSLRAMTSGFDEALGWLREAQSLAERRGDPHGQAETGWGLAQLAFYAIDPPLAVARGERALALARESGDPELIARCLNLLASATPMMGRAGDAQTYGIAAAAAYATLGDRSMEADTRNALATTALYQGRAAAAVEESRAAYSLTREIADPWGLMWSASHLARALLDTGAYGEALAYAREATVLARREGQALMLSFSLTNLGAVCRALFLLDDAVAAHSEAYEVEAALPSQPYSDIIAGELAADYALAGDWSRAEHHARVAARTRRDYFYTYRGLAQWHETAALLRAGDTALAEAEVRRFGASFGDCRRFAIPHHRSLALLAGARGDLPGAIRELDAAAALADAFALPGERWLVSAALARHLRALGDHERADAETTRATALIRDLAATLPEADAREGFLAGAALVSEG